MSSISASQALGINSSLIAVRTRRRTAHPYRSRRAPLRYAGTACPWGTPLARHEKFLQVLKAALEDAATLGRSTVCESYKLPSRASIRPHRNDPLHENDWEESRSGSPRFVITSEKLSANQSCAYVGARDRLAPCQACPGSGADRGLRIRHQCQCWVWARLVHGARRLELKGESVRELWVAKARLDEAAIQ
jgi:hypothetical protein